MCAILDANVVAEVFRHDCSPGAGVFRRWIDQGNGRLVVGGRLRRELGRNGSFGIWLQQALLSGRAKNVADADVDREAKSLVAEASYQSNDEHVLALARVSGARILYSRDKALRKDFRNRQLIADPRGKLYPESIGATKCRQWLQRQRGLCAS